MNLWSRQPDEPAAEYQLFTAWLQLEKRRPMRQAAASLGCSMHRLRQLSSRHRWKTRATAFDNFRADAASSALDQLLQREKLGWQERAQLFRLQEWALHEEMIEAGFAVARQLRAHPRRCTLSQLTALFNLASILGRRASGMPLESDPPGSRPFEPPWPDLSFEEHLRRAYPDLDSSDADPTPPGRPDQNLCRR